jgi:STE24 endopeptidase
MSIRPRERKDLSLAEIIPELDVKRAKRYSRARLAIMAANMAVTAAELAIFGMSGGSSRLQRLIRRRVQQPDFATAAYAAVTLTGAGLLAIPRGYLGGYLVERGFGLTKQAPADWLADRLKALGLSMALETPVLTAIYAAIRRRPRDWWLLLSAAAVPFTVLLVNLGPVLIAPIFNTYDALEDPALEERIKRLAQRAGIEVADVYRMDMSRQTEKANAFFTGLGGTKRIVLADTLLDRFDAEEVEAVVAHELGHQVHGDIWRLIAFSGAATFAGLFALSRLAPALIERLSHRRDVGRLDEESSLPFLALAGGLIGVVATPINAWFNRSIERRTDRFALTITGNGRAYVSAMQRLAGQNLTDPNPSKAVVLLLYTHPPVAERIDMACRADRGSVR